MRKLSYKIFENLSDKDYLDLRDDLVPIKHLMETILLPYGWIVDNSDKLKEALVISFLNYDNDFVGSLGLSFDQTNLKGFNFAFIKTVDVGKIRYYKGTSIIKNKPLSYFKKSVLIDCINRTISLYNMWSKELIIESGEKIEIP